MSRISPNEAKAWGEATKLNITSLDTDLLDQLESEILARIGVAFDTTTWLDEISTPKIVRTAIAKTYVAWVYDRQYSENLTDAPNYGQRLLANAELIILGLIDGTIEIPGSGSDSGGVPAFYPTDASSAASPTFEDPSLGPAAFSMSRLF